MSDVFSPEKRSQVMSRIRGKGNKDTELALRAILRENRITGWRRHLSLPGTPDFAFGKAKLAIFVDGCFWHCCPKCSNKPANNREFWARKLAGNVERDARVNAALKARGWRVLRIWEHELKDAARVARRVRVALGR